ncbi:MAG: cytochrome c-type biogenesis protein CcmH [Gammaproteobacteria bacterium]|jgi:cytochrome c-type biogenesis protein CcmH|nr:cytochrome c-type biogenesis protein CcmH [Gammaproteobacteria bacterium]
MTRALLPLGGVLILVCALLLASGATARVEVYEFDNAEQEARYNKLITELRCLVCQNQNLADSNAELAVDLRRKTYTMVKADKSEREIADFMVARYGEFVLYRPPFNRHTLLLWIGPFVIMVLGVGLLIGTIRRRRDAQPTEIDQAKLEAAAALLETDSDRKPR